MSRKLPWLFTKMFSLRKRAKLQEQQNKEFLNSTGIAQQTHFENLPIEIYFCVFEYLNFKEIIQLRLVNHFLKRIIDNAGFLWLQIAVKIEIDSALNLNNRLKFIRERKKLKHIR